MIKDLELNDNNSETIGKMTKETENFTMPAFMGFGKNCR